MKKLFAPLFLLGIAFASCSKEEVPTEEPQEKTVTEKPNLEVEQFMYEVMSEIYLYKADVPELADNHFLTTSARNGFLGSFDSPENLYYEGLVAGQDEFSFMTDDYVALRKLLDEGIAGTTGMDYGLSLFSNNHDIFGFIRYIIPGSSADKAGLKRGDYFVEIDGKSLNLDNYQSILQSLNDKSSYTITKAELSGGTLSATNEVIELTKEEIAEDPILVTNIIEEEGRKIGYLMYNSFTPNFDTKLNAVFADFKSKGVTDLVLDVRYNGGGNVATAIDLAGMITGQFKDQVILKYKYNQEYQKYFETNRPGDLLQKFNDTLSTGEKLNSLQHTKITVIATKSSASASELVIHALKPYIDVAHIGTNTRGKFQASSTYYDSPNFRLTNDAGTVHVNPNHKYAIQPLIVKYANKNDESDFVDGLAPTVEIKEKVSELGVLGDPSERLLRAAINNILGKSQQEPTASVKKIDRDFKLVGESDMLDLNYQRMYIDLPLERK